MARWRHLKNAPIIEALIDLRVSTPTGWTIDRLGPVRDELAKFYPEVRQRKRWHAAISVSQSDATTVQADAGTPDGFLCYSLDKLQIVQARLDGFTFSRLTPYESWDRLRDEAKRLWLIYERLVKPVEVTRVAVRYINRLELPLPFDDFRQWILTVPEIAPDLPQRLAGYFLRLNLPYPVNGRHVFVNVTQKLDPGSPEQFVTMIFDIDASVPESFDPTDQLIWNRFEELRKIKNKVFFQSLTEEMLARYEK